MDTSSEPSLSQRSTLISYIETTGKLYFFALHSLLLVLGVYCIRSTFVTRGPGRHSSHSDQVSRDDNECLEATICGNKLDKDDISDQADCFNQFIKWMFNSQHHKLSQYISFWLQRLNLLIEKHGMPNMKVQIFARDEFPFLFQKLKFWQSYDGKTAFVAMHSMRRDLHLIVNICDTGEGQRKQTTLEVEIAGYIVTVTPSFTCSVLNPPEIVDIAIVPSNVSYESITAQVINSEVENPLICDTKKVKTVLRDAFSHSITLEDAQVPQLEDHKGFVQASVSSTSAHSEEQKTVSAGTNDSEASVDEGTVDSDISSCVESEKAENGLAAHVPEIKILPATPQTDKSKEMTFLPRLDSSLQRTSVSTCDMSMVDTGVSESIPISSRDDMELSLSSRRNVGNKLTSQSFNYGSKQRNVLQGIDRSYLALSPTAISSQTKKSSLVMEIEENMEIKYHYISPSMARKGTYTTKGRKLHIHNNHIFTAKHFRGLPPECGVCSLPLVRRPWKQGYQCKDCDIIVHKRCHCLTEQSCPRSSLASMHIEYPGSTSV